LLRCQGVQNIELPNPKLKSALNAAYDHKARPSETDRWTDRWTDGRTSWQIAGRFVLTNASRAK